MMLLDREKRGSWMDKIARVYTTRKQQDGVVMDDGEIMDREIEHLLTLSVCYQIAIGFIPLPFITPMNPVSTFA